MSWPVINRNESKIDPQAPPLLSEQIKQRIRSLFPRYETRKAVILPALHLVQDACGNVSWQAMKEVADLLELPPGIVYDTLSYYTHFWTEGRGRKVILVCRSLACQVMGHEAVLQAIKDHLHIDEHETTPDGEWSLMTEECLGVCEHGPAMLINGRLHSRVRPEDVPRILADPKCADLDVPETDTTQAPTQADAALQKALGLGQGPEPAGPGPKTQA